MAVAASFVEKMNISQPGVNSTVQFVIPGTVANGENQTRKDPFVKVIYRYFFLKHKSSSTYILKTIIHKNPRKLYHKNNTIKSC